MRLFKRGDVWWVDYRLDGQRFRESAGTSSKVEAEKFLRQKLRRSPTSAVLSLPEVEKATALRLSELETLWLEEAFQKKSLADDEQRFAGIVEYFGDVAVASITPTAIGRLRKHLQQSDNGRGGTFSLATCNRYLALLRAALNLAVEKELLDRAPKIKLFKEDNRRERVVTRGEYDLLLRSTNSEQLKRAIILGYWTAMRLGEICRLTWDDINLQNRTIRIRVSKSGKPRTVPIHSELLAHLKRWCSENPREQDVIAYLDTTISRYFSRLVRKLGLDGVVFHSLRHSALSNLRRAGADIHVLQSISGHCTLSMVQRYVHVDYKDVAEIFKRM